MTRLWGDGDDSNRLRAYGIILRILWENRDDMEIYGIMMNNAKNLKQVIYPLRSLSFTVYRMVINGEHIASSLPNKGKNRWCVYHGALVFSPWIAPWRSQQTTRHRHPRRPGRLVAAWRLLSRIPRSWSSAINGHFRFLNWRYLT